MLLFILISWNIAGVVRYFNTSHVTVYRKLHCARNVKNSNFNTSHVTVYRIRSLRRGCIIFDFNTSHVTVYPNSGSCSSHVSGFQYISCYCLSICSIGFIFHCPISIHLMLLFIVIRASLSPISYRFQYISCYCLSSTTHRSLEQSIYFNTSHVTVYLRDLI